MQFFYRRPPPPLPDGSLRRTVKFSNSCRSKFRSSHFWAVSKSIKVAFESWTRKLDRFVFPCRTPRSCSRDKTSLQASRSWVPVCRTLVMRSIKNPMTRPFSVKCPRNGGPMLRPDIHWFAVVSFLHALNLPGETSEFGDDNIIIK